MPAGSLFTSVLEAVVEQTGLSVGGEVVAQRLLGVCARQRDPTLILVVREDLWVAT